MSTKQDQSSTVDSNPIVRRLQGRVSQLLRHGRVKDPELMQSAVEAITELTDAAQCLLDYLAEADGSGEAITMNRMQWVIDRVAGKNGGAA